MNQGGEKKMVKLNEKRREPRSIGAPSFLISFPEFMLLVGVTNIIFAIFLLLR